FLKFRHLAEGLGHRAVVATRADDDAGDEDATLALDLEAVALPRDGGHPRALADVGAGDPGAIEQVMVELAAHDAVAGRPVPPRLVDLAVEAEPTGGERLDRQRVLLGVDLDVAQRLGRHPARADLHPGERRRVEQERPQARASQAPRRRAAARSTTDDD